MRRGLEKRSYAILFGPNAGHVYTVLELGNVPKIDTQTSEDSTHATRRG